MIAHLIESTLVLLIALVAAQLPRLAARTRFAIVYAALVKFAIPSAIVPWLGLRTVPARSVVLTLIAATTPRVSPHTRISLTTVWAVVAIGIFVATIVRTRRATRAVLRDAVDASPRAHAALARIGCNVPLKQSSAIVAPVAIGIVKPIIVVPDPSPLDDDELASILAHETAHVARRDNLLAVVESLFAAALWFHPLVWIARRVLAAAREEACDAAAAATRGAATYLSALAKVCRAAMAPRVTGISCAAGARINERMEAIMRLNLRKTLSHRLVLFSAALLIAAFTAGAGVLHAATAAKSDVPAISVQFKDADLIDVLHSFEELANVKINVADAVHGTISVSLRDVPWDEALRRIVTDAGYTITRDNETTFSVR